MTIAVRSTTRTPASGPGCVIPPSSLHTFRVPSSEFGVVRHFLGVGLGVDGHVDHAGLAAGERALDSRGNILVPFGIFAVAPESFGHLVQPGARAPVDAGLPRPRAER